MKKISLSILAVLALGLSGCSSKPEQVQSIASNQSIQYVYAVQPNYEAEKILEEEFGDTTIPWDNDSLERVRVARSALRAKGQYLKDRLDFNSALPYYVYKEAFEFIKNQYGIIQHELDARVLIVGAVSDKGKVIYDFVKADIHAMLNSQQLKIAATEKSINDIASKDTVEEIKSMFNAVQPLIGMVL